MNLLSTAPKTPLLNLRQMNQKSNKMIQNWLLKDMDEKITAFAGLIDAGGVDNSKPMINEKELTKCSNLRKHLRHRSIR